MKIRRQKKPVSKFCQHHPWPDFLGLNRFAVLPAKRVAPGFRRVIPFQLLYKARSKGGEGVRLQIVNFAWVIG